MSERRFHIEISGTHNETDHRPFDDLCDNFTTTLPARGFVVKASTLEFDYVEDEPVEAEEPRHLLGFAIFDPRGLTVAQVKARVQDIEDIDVLHAGAGLERAHSKFDGGRVKVLHHIESRVQRLIG